MYRVLVADDEPIERMVVTKKLQKYFPGQLEVFQAANGRQWKYFAERVWISLFWTLKCRELTA